MGLRSSPRRLATRGVPRCRNSIFARRGVGSGNWSASSCSGIDRSVASSSRSTDRCSGCSRRAASGGMPRWTSVTRCRWRAASSSGGSGCSGWRSVSPSRVTTCCMRSSRSTCLPSGSLWHTFSSWSQSGSSSARSGSGWRISSHLWLSSYSRGCPSGRCGY